MKLREGESWVPADEYGRSLKQGLGVNLLVKDVAKAAAFQTKVLAAEAVYADPDFAAMRAGGSEWMLHADHTYQDHEMAGVIAGVDVRGQGAELRLYGRDPDAAEAAAREGGWTVLAGSADKPHGQRECHIVDDDGYVWVPGIPI